MPEHLVASLLTALIGGIVDLDSTATWQFMISQPIVAAPLTGLFTGSMYGDVTGGLQVGLALGAILQLIWIEKLPLGMNVPPDAALASVLSVSLGFIAGLELETYAQREVCYTIAMLISVGLGLTGRSLDMFVRRLNTDVDNWVSSKVENDQLWSVSIGHTIGGICTFTKAFIFCFLVVWLGVEPLRYFTSSLGYQHSMGFIIVQGMLPAVGFSVLASMCIKNARELKFFIAGVVCFTILPAHLWIAIAVTAVIMIKHLLHKTGAEK